MRGAPSIRTLVIDDHPDAAEGLAQLIEAILPAAETRYALDGDAGLKLACAWWPHLVITDIDMPMLSGIEAALEMRSLLSEQPLTIVAITGDKRWIDDPMAKAVFDAVLVKPVDIDLLLTFVAPM